MSIVALNFCFIVICGLLIGSFLNVCIYRIPRGVFWKSHRSFCPHCQAQIPFYFNIPLLSFFFLRAKSSCCQKRISLQYPLIELISGILAGILFLKFPFISFDVYDFFSFDSQNFFRFVHGSVFLSLMIVCAGIDLNFMIIPDKLNLPALLIVPLVAYFHPDLSFRSALLGALLGGGLIYLIAWIYYILRASEGIGMGDAKLLAVIGGWLGLESVFPVLFIGSLSGSVLGCCFLLSKNKLSLKAKIPFGPFLVLGASIYLLFPLEWLELFLLL